MSLQSLTFILSVILLMGNAYTENTWGDATTLTSTPSGPTAISPTSSQVSSSATGTAVSAWIQDGTVYASYYNGTSWSAPEAISGTSVVSFSIAMNASGTAMATWVTSTGFNFDVLARKLVGGVWEASTQTITSAQAVPSSGTPSPQIAINDSGHAIVLWIVGPINTLNSSYYDGTSWGTVKTNIVTAGAVVSSTHAVVLDNNDKAVATWTLPSAFPGTYTIYANTANAGTWSSDSAISVTTLVLSVTASLSIDKTTGDAIAVWGQLTAIPPAVVAANFYNGATWAGAITISGATVPISPTITFSMNTLGEGIALWIGSSGPAPYYIQASRFNGGSWLTGSWATSAISEEATNANNLNNPSISLNNTGDAIAVWSESTNTSVPYTPFLTKANQFTSGSWGDTSSITTFDQAESPSGNETNPHVSLSANGNAMAVWGEDGTATEYIRYAAFSTPPVPATLSGYRVKNRLGTQTEYFNQLNWTSFPTTPSYYILTRNGVGLSSIPGPERSYRDHNVIKSPYPYTYILTGYDSLGVEIDSISTTVQ